MALTHPHFAQQHLEVSKAISRAVVVSEKQLQSNRKADTLTRGRDKMCTVTMVTRRVSNSRKLTMFDVVCECAESESLCQLIAGREFWSGFTHLRRPSFFGLDYRGGEGRRELGASALIDSSKLKLRNRDNSMGIQ
jgi:hypothetical protein